MYFKIKNYDDAKRYWRTCRFPQNGKPLLTSARLFKDTENNFYVEVHKIKVFTITPDNKIIFNLSARQAQQISMSLSQVLNRIVPFLWFRLDTGRYGVTLTTDWRSRINHVRASNPGIPWITAVKQLTDEIFDGITFSLKDGKCLNPRIPASPTINTDARLVWLRKLRAFKRAVKVRHKLGAFDSLVPLVANDNTFYNVEFEEKTFLMVKDAIDSGSFTIDLARNIFLINVRYQWGRRSATADHIAQHMYNYIKGNSYNLRKHFGVFGEINEQNMAG